MPAQGDPEEWPPVETLNGGSSLFPLLWKRTCPQRAGGVGLRQSYLPRLDEFLNSKLAYAFT